jgi:hypothetical protein
VESHVAHKMTSCICGIRFCKIRDRKLLIGYHCFALCCKLWFEDRRGSVIGSYVINTTQYSINMYRSNSLASTDISLFVYSVYGNITRRNFMCIVCATCVAGTRFVVHNWTFPMNGTILQTNHSDFAQRDYVMPIQRVLYRMNVNSRTDKNASGEHW